MSVALAACAAFLMAVGLDPAAKAKKPGTLTPELAN
jgi:hypothetical protein